MTGRRTFRRAVILAAVFCAGAGALAQTATATHNITIQLAPERATNTVGEPHCVTATVRSVGHGQPQPVAGATVRFTVTGANSASGVGVTGADGQTTFCYTGTRAGTDMITAFVDLNRNGVRDPGERDAGATKTYLPGPTRTVTLAPPAATNDVGQQHCVTATARDAFGNPTPGVALLFSVTGANAATGTAVTNASGQAQFCYTGTRAGTDTITALADVNRNGAADVGEPLGAAEKVYVPIGPSTLTLTPPAAENPVGTQHCVTATARDAFGNPAAGVRIVFTVTGSNPTGGVVTTAANGQAVFCYTGTRAGPDAIDAFADTNGNGTRDVGEPAATATKVFLPGAPASVTVTPPTAENVVGTQHCVLATVRDAFGNQLANVAVLFEVTGANPTRATVTTDVNGNAVFCYTGTRSGLDTIRATADSNSNGTADVGEPFGAATKLYHPGAPATVTVTPATAVNAAGEQHCVTASVRDAFGNPVGAGETVLFSVTGVNPQPTAAATTNGQGQATFCYTGTRAGEDVITAVADANRSGTADPGEPTGLATKTYRPGPPASLVLAPKTAVNVAGEEHCVTATVTDRFGNPTPGVAVEFTVSGANPRAGAAVTDANGVARFCYTGTRAGTDTITASVPGGPSDTATKTYRPGPPAIVTVTPPTAVNPAGQQHCVTATVTDRFGNPVGAGVTVFFTVEGANPRPQSAQTTNADSKATFCYTGTRAGEDVIRAVADANASGTADAGEPFGVATKTYVPGPPNTLTLTPKTAVNVVGQEHCVTAHVEDAFKNPTPGITVRFNVTGSVTTTQTTVTVGASGSATTNGQGDARFCYTSELPGQNAITAFADTNGNGVQDPGEPFDAATKTFVLPPSTPGCDVTITNGGFITTVAGDRASFGGNANVALNGTVSGQEQYTDHGPVQPLSVHSIEILAVECAADRKHGTIWGNASIDGAGSFVFRIAVTDLGEPSTLDTYGMLLSTAYYSGERPLEGGNVQIR